MGLHFNWLTIMLDWLIDWCVQVPAVLRVVWAGDDRPDVLDAVQPAVHLPAPLRYGYIRPQRSRRPPGQPTSPLQCRQVGDSTSIEYKCNTEYSVQTVQRI